MPFRVAEHVAGAYFTDRADEVAAVRRAMADRGRLLVTGPRSMGKSTLVRVAADSYWPAAGLAVELDGRTYHRFWQSQINDRTRDSDLAARGIRVMRITWDQLTRDLERTMVCVAQALVVRGT